MVPVILISWGAYLVPLMLLRPCEWIVALMKLNVSQKKTLARTQCRLTAFTLVEVMIVVAIIGLLSAIALPPFAGARETSWKVSCQETLRQMEHAKAVAAIENQWGQGTSAATLGNPFYKDTISEYLRGGVRPVCPTGPDCYYNGVSENASCTSGLVGHELQ